MLNLALSVQPVAFSAYTAGGNPILELQFGPANAHLRHYLGGGTIGQRVGRKVSRDYRACADVAVITDGQALVHRNVRS
jgi:hypothetical protein